MQWHVLAITMPEEQDSQIMGLRARVVTASRTRAKAARLSATVLASATRASVVWMSQSRAQHRADQRGVSNQRLTYADAYTKFATKGRTLVSQGLGALGRRMRHRANEHGRHKGTQVRGVSKANPDRNVRSAQGRVYPVPWAWLC